MSATLQLVIGLFAVLCLVLGFDGPPLAAGTQTVGSPQNRPASGDAHSQGNSDQIRITHLDLDLTVHFDRRELSGVAVLDIERQPGVADRVPLQLDTRGLTIVNVGIRSSKSDPLK